MPVAGVVSTGAAVAVTASESEVEGSGRTTDTVASGELSEGCGCRTLHTA